MGITDCMHVCDPNGTLDEGYIHTLMHLQLHFSNVSTGIMLENTT